MEIDKDQIKGVCDMVGTMFDDLEVFKCEDPKTVVLALLELLKIAEFENECSPIHNLAFTCGAKLLSNHLLSLL